MRYQRLREHQLKGSITVGLTSCLFCLDSAALPMLKEQQYYLFGQIKTNQTVGQPYSVGYPYGECYLGPPMLMKMHPTACKSPSYSLSTILSPQKLFAKAFHSKSCNVTLLLLQKITYLKSCRKLSLLKILRLVDQSF